MGDATEKMVPIRGWAIAVFVVAIAACVPAIARAHRFGGPNDPCERKIGLSLIHITLYQPQFDPDAEYCESVPRAGNTVLVVDVLGDQLRKVAMGVEVLAVRPSQAARTVLSVPPQVYRRGVADAQMTLTGDSPYLVRIHLEGAGEVKSQVLSFPIRVGSWYRAFVTPSLIVLGVLALMAISVIRYRLSSSAPASADPPVRLQVRLIASAALVCSLLIAGCSRGVPPQNPVLPDIQVIDDHGRQMSLGALRGKVVLLEFIHVGCPGVCDNLINKFGQIADMLGPNLGSRVVLLTVTNDPQHDSPPMLLQLARDRAADLNGWLFVTGKPGDVDRIIKAFGLHNERLPDGSPNHITQVFLLGPDLRARQEYAGMAMDLHSVRIAIKETLKSGGPS
jgi:cytochrome oxidase Cu insertion factor (SCO1/SenC/PrrC family)